MIKTLLSFYIICFVLYVYFSRQPDYLDGEFAKATIQYSISKTNQQPVFEAVFTVNKINYAFNAEYPFRKLTSGEKVSIIFDSSNPQNAAVYKWWGYWIQWDELLASIFIPFILFFAANTITKNPTPEALIEDMEMDNKLRK